MKKIITFLIIVLILVATGLYFYKNTDLIKRHNKFNKDTEMAYLSSELKNVDHSFNMLLLSNIVESYHTTSKYAVRKDYNFFKQVKNKQLFIMEYIINEDSIDNNEFVILGNDGSVITDVEPTDDTLTAYFPYKDFNKVYKAYFNESLKEKDKVKSNLDNKYDKSKDYVYYINKRPGTNGMKVSLDILNVEMLGSEYIAKIQLNYSETLVSSLGVSNDTAELKYDKIDNHIVFKSFIVK